MTTTTMWQTVLQSQAIHPDWDAAMHAGYLEHEAFLDPTALTGGTPEEVIGRWLADNVASGRLELTWRNAGMPARPCGGHHPAGGRCSGCSILAGSG
jgi:hypothetical protein